MTSETGRAQPPVGIDLGTTYSVVAYLDATGRPLTVPNRAGDLITPSALAFEDGAIVVGKEAVKGSVIAPQAFAECFKRDMGRAAYHHLLAGQELPPEVLNGFLLERLKEDAERKLGPIRQVVVTVPAFFDETRRKATQDAGKLAGLDVIDIINEPTAAAIAFGYHRSMHGKPAAEAPERVLVYDLGGGTFDVTILEIDGNAFRTLATDGDVQLGGKDFDERLVNHLAEHFSAMHGVDPRSDPSDAAQLWLDAQEAKRALSERTRTTVVCSHAGIRLREEITRELFEKITKDLLDRTETTTELVLKQAGIDWAGIDRVLLAGGSTRMPMVIEMLRRISGKQPDASESPDEVVAQGAAIYAGLLTRDLSDTPDRKFSLVNVNSHSLGVVGVDPATGHKRNVIVIRKNTPLPCRAVKRFCTASPNQTTVLVPIVEGESHRPEDCIALGKCVIHDLPTGLPQRSGVEVEFNYAANGRLSVVARVPAVRQSASVNIERRTERDLRDLDYWRAKLSGSSAASSSNQDRAAALQRLDFLYTKAGEEAMKTTIPPELEKAKQAAVSAVAQLRRDETALKRSEALHAAAVGPHETAKLTADLVRARSAFQQATIHARFTALALGRECVQAKVRLRELENNLPEIRALQQQLNVAGQG
jgi:molecular chaperone DnaK